MRNIFVWLLFAIMLLGSLSANYYKGDGTYELYINDSVKSENNYTIKLVAIGLEYGHDVPIPANATYVISRSGSTTHNRTLEAGEDYTATAKGGTQNMTITLVGLGNEIANDSISYYAITTVESFYYVPVIDLNITLLSVDPKPFTAEVKWETNVSSNGTVRLYDSDGDYYSKIEDGSKITSHSKAFTGLKSNTNYSVMVTACTNVSCVNSSKYKFTTDMVIPEISNVKVLAVGETWANIYWDTDVDSDERVYYRKAGSGSWIQAPPKSSPWNKMRDFLAYEPGIVYGPPGV